MSAPLPPPGWYPNPRGAGRAYWDGTQWDLPRPTKSRPALPLVLIVAGLVLALVLIAVVASTLSGGRKDRAAKSPAAPRTIASYTIPPLPIVVPTAAPDAPPAKIIGPGARTWATADSTCTSDVNGSPIDLRASRVEIGAIGDFPGTTAKVTMTYSGDIPTIGTSLWSLLATNSAGETVQLGYKTLNGDKIAYFWFPWSDGEQHNIGWSVDTGTPGRLVMYMPHDALMRLGTLWSWSTVVNVDGTDIDTC